MIIAISHESSKSLSGMSEAESSVYPAPVDAAVIATLNFSSQDAPPDAMIALSFLYVPGVIYTDKPLFFITGYLWESKVTSLLFYSQFHSLFQIHV